MIVLVYHPVAAEGESFAQTTFGLTLVGVFQEQPYHLHPQGLFHPREIEVGNQVGIVFHLPFAATHGTRHLAVLAQILATIDAEKSRLHQKPAFCNLGNQIVSTHNIVISSFNCTNSFKRFCLLLSSFFCIGSNFLSRS